VRLMLDVKQGKVFVSKGAAEFSPLFTITESFTADSGTPAATVDGRNVKTVRYADGVYRVSGPNQWVEEDRNGGFKFNYSEDKRDDSAVFLSDPGRSVRLMLDVKQGKVFVSKGAAEFSPLFTITDSSAAGSTPPAAAVNGRNVKTVRYADGVYRLIGLRRWIEEDSKGAAKYSFGEESRDDASVVLFDPGRNFRVRLDLKQRQIMVAVGESKFAPLYAITDASPTEGGK
jgi:hypothetical protein